MSAVWGTNLKVSIFGESHGQGIGINISGLPSGKKIDFDEIAFEMARRAPGQSELTTKRKEDDKPEVLSGIFNGYTTGAPLCILIRNTNTKSEDYSRTKDILRPSHADYTGFMKYGGYNDYRGGGHFSGRITASLVFAGAVAKQLLSESNIIIGSHIKSIYNIKDKEFNKTAIDVKLLKKLHNMKFPVIDETAGNAMKECIVETSNSKDSVGGVVETAILNIKSGVGEPFFDSLESTIAHLIFSVPAVKGLDFGAGVDISTKKGSEANDAFYTDNGIVKTKTNNNGGILGGITSGMPVIFKTYLKPTASIALEQDSVNMAENQNEKLEIVGRHDPCIVPRAVSVIEAVTAIAVLDLIMTYNARKI